ncbi:TIR domain-containing protein [Streptomyces prasinus]|uniref:TIR domain-containing protein n=1 Tax=Streptomyces prasinus TaxID=67345 RepID=UPI0036C8CD76
MARPRVFISFQMKDRWARDFLKRNFRANSGFEFIDYSVHDPFDSSWKTQCKPRIAESHGTIVLIGPTTYESEPVAWEITETRVQGHPIFGIQVTDGETHQLPDGLSPNDVVRWNFTDISSRLAAWV